MDKNKILIIECENGHVCKQKNKRLSFIKLDEGYFVEFVTLSKDLSPRAIHTTAKNKIVSTGLKLTKETATALFLALGGQLEKDGLIYFK